MPKQPWSSPSFHGGMATDRRKVSKARLINDVYETACSSAALPVPEDSVAQGRSLIHQRDEIEQIA